MGNLEDWIISELHIREMSQREAARRAGISHAYLSDILRGDKPVSCNFCFAVAKALNEPVWKVLQLAGLVDYVPKNLIESDEINSLIARFNELSPPNKEDVIKYIDFVLLKQRTKAP